MKQSRIIYKPRWLDEDQAKKLYDAAANMDLKQYPVTVWDKTFLQPRLTAWCSDDGKGYSYSNQITPVVPWPSEFLDCRAKLEDECGVRLPTCLVNMYRDGQDSVGWHKDDESIFGKDPTIVSISLGGTRRFKLRNSQTKETQEFDLSDGDLLLFSGKYATEWVHSIVKTAKVVDTRISLTFRTVD